MYRFLMIASLICMSGCIDPKVNTKVDANAKVDVQTEIQTQVDTFLKANLDSILKAQVDTKIQGVGFDIQNKLSDELKAEITSTIQSDLQTQIKAFLATNTQNVGMFSGGAIYVVILAVIFFIIILVTIIYLIKSILKWKKLWTLLSDSVEQCEPTQTKDIKEHFSKSLEAAGLKDIAQENLKNRGIFKK